MTARGEQDGRRLRAGSRHRRAPRQGPVRDTWLPLDLPGSIAKAPPKEPILGAGHECPRHRVTGMEGCRRMPIRTVGDFELQMLAPLNLNP